MSQLDGVKFHPGKLGSCNHHLRILQVWYTQDTNTVITLKPFFFSKYTEKLSTFVHIHFERFFFKNDLAVSRLLFKGKSFGTFQKKHLINVSTSYLCFWLKAWIIESSWIKKIYYIPCFERDFCNSVIGICSRHSLSNKLISANDPAPTSTSNISREFKKFSPLSNIIDFT